MATPPSSPPSITELPPAPNSATDSPAEFDTKANNTVAAQVVMIPQINTANAWAETTAQEVYDNALEANDRAVDSENSAIASSLSAALSAGSANYEGEWSTLTGSLSKPSSVNHNGSYWVLNVDLADVTASEPSTTNTDWSLLSSYRWKVISTSGGITPNSYELCTAATELTRTMPTLFEGDFVVLNNSPQSAANVRIPITGITIYGNKDTLVDGDFLILEAGDTAHIAAETSTIMRFV